MGGDYSWIAAFAIPLIFVGIAFLAHGFPNIHIGKKEVHKHYYNDKG